MKENLVSKLEIIKEEVQKSPIAYVFLLLGIIFAICYAIITRWVSDSAFISFRIARNFYFGSSFSFNPEESFEVSSNFLWKALIYLGMNFHIDPIRLSMIIGLVSYLSLLLLVFFISKEKSQKTESYLPVAFLLLATNPNSLAYASSGLETSLFSVLLFLGFSCFYFVKRVRHLFLGNLFLIMASITRGEGIFFYALGVIYSIRFLYIDEDRKQRIIKLLVCNFPFLMFYIPYTFFRLSYHETIVFSDAFQFHFTKETMFQGFEYLRLYFLSNAFLFIIPILLLINFSKKEILSRKLKPSSYKDLFSTEKNPAKVEDPRKLLLYIIFPYLVYILFIGGSSEFGRLLVPLNSFLFLYTELTIYKKVSNPKYNIPLIIVLVLMNFISLDPYRNSTRKEINEISKEEDIYRLNDIYKIKNLCLSIRDIFKERKLRVGFGKSQNILVYYLEPKYALDTSKLERKHSKIEPKKLKKLILKKLKKKSILVHLDNRNLIGNKNYNTLVWREYPINFRILYYDSSFLEKLKETNQFQYISFPKYLDLYYSKIESFSLKKIKTDYKRFKEFYFNHNNDKERENRFLEILN
ncbi:MAG: hypothetical protein SFU98_19305 [Leptospiraceae bacterium]|nr:hypothetical protein [Leptospiraceae bacterium]